MLAAVPCLFAVFLAVLVLVHRHHHHNVAYLRVVAMSEGHAQ